jgi:hypothetical protein
LQQRAERLKDQEKKRAAAAAKRTLESGCEAKERQKALLGTQRKKDKFGYKSSQFHLGAFLKVGGKNDGIRNGSLVAMEEVEDEDFFQDDDLDDETLMGALEVEPVGSATYLAHQHGSDKGKETTSNMMLPPPLPRLDMSGKQHQPAQAFCAEEDLSSLWDDLESSTQVARDLEGCGRSIFDKPASSLNTSFGSGSLDLTAEELDQLDPPAPTSPRATSALRTAPFCAMQPPRMPSKPSQVSPRSWSPPKQVQNTSVNLPKRELAIKGPIPPTRSLHCSPELGFTFTQLESFVEEDIQLTQAIPG